MTDIFIQGGQALLDGTITETSLRIGDGKIQSIDAGPGRSALAIDARRLLVLPGIVDLHGDAFERQIMPRPGVDFPLDVALLESDRQAVSNGITTAFHAATWSWEPGLRSGDSAARLLEAIERLRPQLRADTRFHLRHETYNLDAEDSIRRWLSEGRIDLLAFNDHMDAAVAGHDHPQKRRRMIERSGLSPAAFDDLVAEVLSRAYAVPDSITRLAQAATAAGVRMLSHDDRSPAMRQAFRDQGVRIAEFPVNEETARAAAAAGDTILFGAPNILRGGSHTGCTRASDMVAKGHCCALTSDYYYPSPLIAAFALADDILPLPQAWDLVSAGPARAAGLSDRGVLAPGARGDLVLVDDARPRPRVVAVLAAGRLVCLADADRIMRQAPPRAITQSESLAAE
ncbi:MAG: alpha-D-ribose 1-methylphosphonate 5-triphosphate diphosphatase [Alphaproteobacteria bacterium]|nr:alpha-D-ribose 1-methylphosphonate 5-triphosphate diphosphatase [Alphaproteobacteria bacterium]